MDRSATGEFRRGWTVILAAAVGVGLGITGLPIYTTGQFILPLQSAFGWSRSAISGGLLCLTLVGVVMAPLVGTWVERSGARRVALLSIPGLAIGYAGLTFSNGSLALYYVGWTVLAFLGAGTSPIVWTRVVAGWFDRQRGLALGLTLCGTGLVALLGPSMIGSVIAAWGWRAGFAALAAAQLVIGLPAFFLLLHPRQDTPSQNATSTTMAPADDTWSAGTGRRQLWQLMLAFFLIAIVVGGMIVHLPAMLADRGVPLAQSSRALGFLGLALMIGRLAIGSLMDRFPAKLVAPAFILLPVLSCLILAQGSGVVLPVLLFGLSAGAEVDLLAYLVSRLFGLRHYARLYGWTLSAFSAGVGLGPVFAGWVHDRSGSYRPALLGFIGLMIIAAVLVGSLGRLRRPT